MLAIQPVQMNSYSSQVKNVSFKQNTRQGLEEDKEFFQQQKEELEGLLRDDKLPNGMKKFLKVANVVTDGIIAGISVACATIAGAGCGKKTFAKVASSGFAKDTSKVLEPVMNIIGKGFKEFKTAAAKVVKKLFGEETGQRIVNYAKTVIQKFKKALHGVNPFKDEATYDKAAQKTATTLGVGSGAASAYATAVKNSEAQEGEF